jgi:hypothetical protein
MKRSATNQDVRGYMQTVYTAMCANFGSAPLERAKSLVALYTLEEKINATSSGSPGVPRLGIPPYQWWNEGLHGLFYLVQRCCRIYAEFCRYRWTLHKFQCAGRIQLQHKLPAANLDGSGVRRRSYNQSCDGYIDRSKGIQQCKPVRV